MNTSSSSQPIYSPPATLVITPYHITSSSTGAYPDALLALLQAIVSQHSIRETSYQSAFYQDLNNASRFYHLQTSPPEPLCGWLTFSRLSSEMNQRHLVPAPQDPSESLCDAPSRNNALSTLALAPSESRPSFTDHLHTLYSHAIPQSSNGIITLGLLPPKHGRHCSISLTRVPFDAPLLLIGTRDIATTDPPNRDPKQESNAIADERVQFEAEMKPQLVQLQRFTGLFPVAAGWRERCYYSSGYRPSSHQDNNQHHDVNGREHEQQGSAAAAAPAAANSGGPGVQEQFLTLSGWKSTEDYARFRKLMVMAAKTKRADGYWDTGLVGRVSPDVVGERVVWLARIA